MFTRNTSPLVAIVLFLSLLPVCAFAQAGWRGTNRQDVKRATSETVYANPAPAVTGTGDIVTTSSLNTSSAGDTIALAAVPNGCRTFACKFDENSGSSAVLTIEITGRNQFGGDSVERFKFDSDETIIGSVPFVANPAPVVTIVSSSNLATSDTLNIFSYGFGIRSDPRDDTDVLSLQVAGSEISDTYTFSTAFPGVGTSSDFSVYVNSSLTSAQRVDFLLATSSDRALAVNSVGPTSNGIRFYKNNP